MIDPGSSVKSSFVQTVLGPVDPVRLGVVLPHEHLIIDVSPAKPNVAPPNSDPALWSEPITLSNYYYARRNIWDYRDSLRMVDVEDAIEAVKRFGAAGGGCIVDVTSRGIARDPIGLLRIAQSTKVHILMGCGYYVHDYHPEELGDRSEREITDEILLELEQGADGTDVKPGIIGEIGLTWPVHADERKVLRAAARAQAEAGAPLSIHPGRDPAAPIDAIRTVEAAGGDPGRTVVGHLDRTLFETADYLELARTGCYLELDLFGLESSFYTMSAIDMPNDAVRIERIIALANAGYEERLLISQDIDTKVRLRKYGGEGYEHILLNVVPVMERKGLGPKDVHRLMVENPAGLLTRN